MALSLDYYGDLKAYWLKGFGHDFAWQIASPLLADIVDSIRQWINGQDSVVGNFRFAHAETILPLACLLAHQNRMSDPVLRSDTDEDVALSRPFKASVFAPFAGNIGFHLYKCGDEEYNVEIRLNERRMQIQGCHANGYLCTLGEFQTAFDQYLYHWDFDSECSIN